LGASKSTKEVDKRLSISREKSKKSRVTVNYIRKDQNSKIEKSHETQKSDIGNSDNKSNKCEIKVQTVDCTDNTGIRSDTNNVNLSENKI
jgi:hypothetical protein